MGLKEGGDNAPDNAGEDGGNCHDEDEQTIGHLAAQHQHAYRGGKAADEHLAFGAGIPEAHAEGRGDRQRDAQQNGDIMQGDQHTAGAERAVEDGGVDGEGVIPGEDTGDHTANNERQQDGNDPNEDGPAQRDLIPTGDIEEGFPGGTGSGLRFIQL